MHRQQDIVAEELILGRRRQLRRAFPTLTITCFVFGATLYTIVALAWLEAGRRFGHEAVLHVQERVLLNIDVDVLRGVRRRNLLGHEACREQGARRRRVHIPGPSIEKRRTVREHGRIGRGDNRVADLTRGRARNCCRNRAATPETEGVAKLVPLPNEMLLAFPDPWP